MKRIAVIAAALLIAAICPGRASAADHWYSFTEIENTNITGLLINDDVNASGGKTVYADDVDASKGADERDYFEFTVDVPADGTYSVWLRAYVTVGSADQATLYHRSNSSLYAAAGGTGSPLWKMVGVDSGAGFVWYPLDARAKNNAEPVLTKDVQLSKGENTVSLSIRSLTSWGLSHYYDCIIITDNTEFDPNTDDWAKLSGTDTSESAVTTEPPATSEPQTTTEPPEPTGTPAASVGTETAAPTGSDSSSGTAAPGSDTSSDIRGGQPAVIIAVIAVAVIIAAAVIFAAVKSKKKKTGM
ncbi:MAG: hypothetical protein MR241_03070 [Firmicutes bacterium]|uniref:CBM6 domain-containing protein n=1 Tax=Candidatus Colimorpha enterica TaxID=3083063 RepID=A0AAE3FGZ9_9BACT|nr:hypothetical protein [Candidatus Colimorpha enterica]